MVMRTIIEHLLPGRVRRISRVRDDYGVSYGVYRLIS